MRVLSVVLVTLFAVATMASAALAGDFNFGSYARNIAMGGAGLALTDDPSTSSVINPAAAAASGSRFQFIVPSLDFHARGAALSDLRSRISELSGGGDDDAIILAEEFGKGPTTLSIGAATGFAGPLGVTAEGEAQGIITPGESFSQWVFAGLPDDAASLAGAIADGTISNTAFTNAINTAIADSQITGTEAADIAAVFTAGTSVQAKMVYSLPAVNWGTGYELENGKMWVGTKMRWMHSESYRWNLQQNPAVTDRLDLEAVKVADGEDSGFGADLGIIYQPKNSIAQWGVVVNNFFDPGLNGIDTPMMLSVGMASQPRARFRYAIDLVNINKAYNERTRLRMGAEWILTDSFVFRAGNSGEGWTYGMSVMGLNFAFSDDAPNMISRVLRF